MSGSNARRIRTWTATLVAVAGSATMQANADTFYVNGSCGDDAWTGTSSVCSAPDGPKLTIQAGINASVNGDTVIVADGVYTGDGNRDLDFAGRLIVLRSENGPESCIIDCQASPNDPHRGFYFHSAETEEAVLEGLTIRNGIVTDASPGGPRGGGILCELASSPTIANCIIIANESFDYEFGNDGGGVACNSSSPTIENCIISGNEAGFGGGIACRASSPVIRNCTIASNRAWGYSYSAYGGGIYSDEFGSPTITDCTISGNWARESHGASGGGIYCGADTQITACTITENAVYGESGASGGGIYCIRGNPKISSCTISRNTSEGWGGGAGVYGYRSSVTVTNCTFTANNATNSQYARGAAIYDNQGSLTASDCAFIGNSSDGDAGAVYVEGGSVTLRNCKFSGNSAGRSGGVLTTDGSTMTVVNCTFGANTAPNGRTLACDSQQQSDVEIANCVLWNGGDEVWNNDGSTITISYSDVQGGWPGPGNISLDPRFAFAADHHLTAESPCIDAGTNSPPGGLPLVDFDGNTRPLDGDGNGVAVADMGVFEFNPGAPSIALTPTSFAFFAPAAGPNPADQVLSIRNCGGGTLNWQILEDCVWLQPIPASGSSSGEIDTVQLRVDVSVVPRGAYACAVTISDASAANNPQIIEVTLEAHGTAYVPAEYPTLQAAIDAAVDQDIIVVADGLYRGEDNKNLDFGGKLVTLHSENGPSNCIIDCEGDGRGFYIHNGETAATVIDGFTITNGSSVYGGGVYCWGASPTIRNCIIVRNEAADGGGVYLRNGSPTVSDCTIAENTATYSGGGVNAAGFGSAPTIRNCTIRANRSNTGGGVNCSAEVLLDGCTITDNHSYAYGGGVQCGGNVTVRNCIISNNSTGFAGGGVRCWGGNPTIQKCLIAHNAAALGGGVYSNSNSNPTIENCAFVGNRAYRYDGGGVSFASGNVTLYNCTFSANSAKNYGGAISCQISSTIVTVSNCILWEDSAAYGPEIAVRAVSTLNLSYCDVQGGQEAVYVEGNLNWGAGNLDADPLFVDPVNGDYHIQTGSPCIDTGDPDFIPQPGETDMDGQVRVWNERVDMGADEFGSFVLGDINCDGAINALDIEPFLLALFDPSGYAANYPDCDINLADLNFDGSIDALDIAPFLGLLFP